MDEDSISNHNETELNQGKSLEDRSSQPIC